MVKIPSFVRKKWEMLRGVVFVLLAALTSFLGYIFVLFNVLPFIVIQPRIWRAFWDQMVAWWLIFPISMFEFLYGVRVHISGDQILCNSPGIIIMNHRTRLDWLFLWLALYKMDPWLLTSEKISLKRMLKLCPGAGWAMQCASYLFLQRKWEKDKQLLGDMIDYYKDMGWAYQILLFPEGTDMTAKTKGISCAYAKENNLPEYDFVLHPRTTGFTFLMDKMRKVDYMEQVYDITVSFKDRIVQSEVELFQGGCPKDICFHIERYDAQVLPQSEIGLSDFCRDIWSEKEEILKDFYNNPISDRDLTESFRKIRTEKGQKANLHKWPVPYSRRQKLVLWINFWSWLLAVFMLSYFFFTPMRIYFILGVLVVLGVIKKYDGFEMLALIWNRKNNKKKIE